MTKRLSLVILVFVLGVSALYAGKGKVRIASDHQGAYVYIDGKKKAMIGEGFTSILLEEGEYTIKVVKPIDDNYEYSQSKGVFVGEDTSTKLSFELTKSFTKEGKSQFAKYYKRSSEIVFDTNTGLQWQDNERVQKPWITKENFKKCQNGNKKACFDTNGDTAENYCNNLELGGYNDWRLPTHDELYSLVYCTSGEKGKFKRFHQGSNNGECSQGSIKPTIIPMFENIQSNIMYWSSSHVDTDDLLSWYISFYDGESGDTRKGNAVNVRCVRDR